MVGIAGDGGGYYTGELLALVVTSSRGVSLRYAQDWGDVCDGKAHNLSDHVVRLAMSSVQKMVVVMMFRGDLTTMFRVVVAPMS